MPKNDPFDVIVVGAGNAALCAAISAKEQGAASVLVLEKAPIEERGGNSLFTAGGFRFVHEGLDDLRRDILDDLSEAEASQIVLPSCEGGILDDLRRVTEVRPTTRFPSCSSAARAKR
jgi:tricarballylate dehydrogenase